MSALITPLTADTERRAASWALIAAGLAVAAERLQEHDGECAAVLEHHASRCRAQVRTLVSTDLDRPGVPVADWDLGRRRVAGQILRDAYTRVRAGGAR